MTVEREITLPEMLEAYVSGNKEYLDDIYQLGYDLSFKIAQKVVKEEDKAQDIAGITILDVMKRMDQCKDAKNFLKWITTTTKHYTLNYIRMETYQEDIPIEEVQEPYQARDDTIDIERKEIVHHILNELDAAEREVILLRYLEGFSIHEIAEKLHVPHPQAAETLFRSKDKFIEKLLRIQEEKGITLL